jgi:hypothetical protein
MGVAAAGTVLAAFTGFFGAAEGSGGVRTLHAFQATFACMGLITVASAGIFAQLSADERPAAKTEADVEG